MYEPHQLLRTIDHHTLPILTLFGLAMVFQTIAMVDAVRVSAREKVISIPLFCTYFWFAHDLGYVVRFHTWFVTYDHWFLKCFWLGLFSAMLLELVFFWQAIKYGRRDYLPNATTLQWGVVVVAGAVASVVAWEFFKSIVNDPLYQVAASLTLFALPLTGAAQMMRRRSFEGQTVALWGGFTAMVPLWWAVTVGYYGFRSWQYVTLGIVGFLMFAALTVVVARGRARMKPCAVQPALVAGAS